MCADGKVSLNRQNRRIALFVAVVLIGAVSAWFVRMATRPCGAFDSTSGCVQRVLLDVAAAGFDPATAKVDWVGFDLGAGGKVALVSLYGPADAGVKGTIALYHAETGALIRVLYERATENKALTLPSTAEVALSLDGSQMAASLYDWDAPEVETTLTVFNTADGTVLHTLPFGSRHGRDCWMMLDFSPDGTRLQCGFVVNDLTTGQLSSVLDANDNILPLYAESIAGKRAPDGTDVSFLDFPDHAGLFDSIDKNMVFAPDSVGLLEVVTANQENRGQRWWTPAPFRNRSVVFVWDGKTRTLLRQFFANDRYIATAWARDGSHFGFISDDFHLTVFRR